MHKPLLVTDFLDRARTHYADTEAVVATTGERYTYAELAERADRFSAALQARGIEKGDRVAVLDPNTHYHLEAAYGSMQLGAVHMPLNYRLTPEDFSYMLEDADVDAIYADYEYAGKIESIRDEVPTETFITNDVDAVEGGEADEAGRSSSDESDSGWESFDAVLEEAGTEYDRPEMAEDDIITINYTSGTTGDPKGVCRTHRAETIHAYVTCVHQGIGDDDVYLWTLPMFHVNGWGHIYAITGMGAKHVCTRGVDAGGIFEAIQTEDVSYMCGAPTVLNMLIDYYGENDPETTGANDVRIATAGSAPPEATIRTVEDEFGWYLKHVYGATETGPLITTSDARRHFDDDSRDRFAVKKRQGLSFLGTEVRVVDEDGNDVPRDNSTVGEIVVSGNQVMEKYWNKPEETEAAFSDRIEGYYHMGDLAVVDENGMISIQDRKKDIIISGGENISSIELEDTLFEHEAVSDVAVIPAPSEEWGETPKAFVVPANGDPDEPGVTVDELVEFTRDNLASYKAVKRVEFVEQLPTTATGKVQKYELREQEWEDEDQMVGQG
ncbi:long-chain-fatty-acid--CoA ligase [Natrarchaeobaculum sulfurireducens]|uniref:3-methylmercaptopropionyl-CoA ligase (DmdB) n=1 Tax=Natrarchaeobaculum sulfurireducens TaxID=2044521 RepID=A0A346PBB2_9EURY|nr:long-chain-fatty-acid--CoA ligase [Natrarchaeobaculum sulfurireducens]AXR76807.1 Acyl-CoA synthetase (AMP-forming)/AMP-acid ligase II [Natrarchaeobaculum sulfurireducens]AXR80477.1 3-methylmercaptopropionyl-CoA ligase (DmdB) [Natrarchaeobaculum sulfurireducens]